MADPYNKNIIGYENIKKELHRISASLSSERSSSYESLHVKQPRGLIIYGPPGVGKTLFSRAFIQETKRYCVELHKNGNNENTIEKIINGFSEAAEHVPSIVFLDDLDKFDNNSYQNKNSDIFVTLQTQIDLNAGKDLIVLATCNELDNLPDSLLRAQRLERKIKMVPPIGKDRALIIRKCLENLPLDDDVNAEDINRLLGNKTCAEIPSLIEQASEYAAFEGRDKVNMNDVIEAALNIIFDCPEQSISDEMKRFIAYHEAGHVLALEMLIEKGGVDYVTVKSTDSIHSGFTAIRKNILQKFYLPMEPVIQMYLAGRASVELEYGIADYGDLDDMEEAYSLVFSKYARTTHDYYIQNNYDQSDRLLDGLETEVRRKLDSLYQETLNFLKENREKLKTLVDALIENETLLNSQIQKIVWTEK